MNPKPPGASHGSTATFSTRAAEGPRRQVAIISSTLDRGPEKTASTPPSKRLRTQPARPSRLACSTVQARNHTPWTRPEMTARTETISSGEVAIGPLAELQDHLVHRETVAGFDLDRGNGAVALGAEHVFHFHRLDHR